MFLTKRVALIIVQANERICHKVKLREWRNKEGITLTEVRDLTGVDESLLCKYETGNSNRRHGSSCESRAISECVSATYFHSN